MKKLYMLIIACSFILQQAHSQHIRYGVFANPSITWFKSDVSRISTSGEQVGFSFGLTIDNFFTPMYAFSSGLSIQWLGGSVRYKNAKTLSTADGEFTLAPNTDVTYNLQYLHVPLSLKFRTTEIGYLTYFAEMGLDPMVNVKASGTFEGGGNNGFISGTGIGDEVNSLYLGYHVSAGVEYHLVGNTLLMGGISFMNGFSNILHDENGAKTILNCFEIRLGIFF